MLQVGDVYFLRLAICSTKTNFDDITFAWKVIQECAEIVRDKQVGQCNGLH